MHVERKKLSVHGDAETSSCLPEGPITFSGIKGNEMDSPQMNQAVQIKPLIKKGTIRRQQIVDASIDIFYEHGYHKASIRDISQRMGITKAAIYYHFRDKEEILYTIVDQGTNELLMAFESALFEKENPFERLRNLILKQIYFMKSQRKKVKILVEDVKFLNGAYKKLIKDKQKTILHLYRANLENLQKQGKLRQFNVTTATFGIFGMINWLDHWYRPEKELSIEEIAEDIVNILMYGLLSEVP
jgi:AcrR family transcriptional regulator